MTILWFVIGILFTGMKV